MLWELHSTPAGAIAAVDPDWQEEGDVAVPDDKARPTCALWGSGPGWPQHPVDPGLLDEGVYSCRAMGRCVVILKNRTRADRLEGWNNQGLHDLILVADTGQVAHCMLQG
ncbi:hypothetical protein V1264_016320 [Littorina saxatilis]|uniref:Uncharacterized protein n=1 Tax=Littorina saxatilis TaxID=31220 RepID=A0AAN9GJ28_9CAEN